MGEHARLGRLRRALPLVCVALIAPSIAAVSHGRAEGAVVVRHSAAYDESEPLADIQPILGKGPLKQFGVGKRPEPKFPEATTSDAVAQSTTAEPSLMPPATVNVLGLSAQDTANVVYKGLLSVSPPDPTGAAGPNHYFQWVNNVFAVYDKTGKRLYGPAAGNTLFDGVEPCAHSNAGDPIVLYDSLAGRFVVSQFAFAIPASGAPPSWQCVAVSTTDNPLGTWARYAFLIDATALDDYPKMGVWNDAYYTTFNMFTGRAVFTGVRVCAFERDAMLAGADARQVCIDPGEEGAFSMLPADADGVAPPEGAPNYLLNLQSDRDYARDGLAVWEFHADWSNPGASSLTKASEISVTSFINRFCVEVCVPQRGTDQALDALDDRPMFRLQYRNFGDHESMVVNHTVDAGDTGVRWYELRKNAGQPWHLAQEGTFAPNDGAHRFMGSVAMDRLGNMALGYSVSSSYMNPSIWYAGRLATDPPGILSRGERVLHNGTASQTSSGRWGDYTHMSVDPADGCTFWYTGEYLDGSSFGWKTRIGAFRFPNCEAA